MTSRPEYDSMGSRWITRSSSPRIEVELLGDGRAEATVIGILGYMLAEDVFDPYDVGSIRRSARWLKVPYERLYDATVIARAAA